MADPMTARLAVRDLLWLDAPENYRPTTVERRDLGVRDGVRWERVEFGSGDGDTVPSFLLTPDEKRGWMIFHTARAPGAGWDRQIRLEAFTLSPGGVPEFASGSKEPPP